MKVIALSDTHNQHHQIDIEPCDILIHAGDHAEYGNEQETLSFLEWFARQPAKHKVFCAGNHDKFIQKSPGFFRASIPHNVIYLQDEEITIEGLRIYSMPHTPKFGYGWAFNDTPEMSQNHCAQIPNGLDILVTHGPPYGIQDLVPYGNVHAGCGYLLEKIEQAMPRYHFFGHIHRDKKGSQTGEYIGKNTKFYNVSIMDERSYKPLHKPVVLEIDKLPENG